MKYKVLPEVTGYINNPTLSSLLDKALIGNSLGKRIFSGGSREHAITYLIGLQDSAKISDMDSKTKAEIDDLLKCLQHNDKVEFSKELPDSIGILEEKNLLNILFIILNEESITTKNRIVLEKAYQALNEVHNKRIENG